MKYLSRAALALLPLAACSDLFLESDRVPTSLVLGDSAVTTVEGLRIEIPVTVLDQRGRPFDRVPGWAAPVWTSSGPAVEVDGTGLLARTSGQAVATVQVAGMTAAARVRVNPTQLRLAVQGIQITQSAQPAGGTAPLVQGRAAAVRVFLQGDRVNFFAPQVRVKVYHGAALAATLTAAANAIPTAVDPGRLDETWNVQLPAELVVPGLRVLVEADPQGLVPLASGSGTVFPAPGVPLAADVRAVPPLYLRVIPIRQAAVGATGEVSQQNLAQYLRPLIDMFPVAQVHADLHAVYSTSITAVNGNSWSELLREINTLRVVEGSQRYYYGVLKRTGGGIAGIGYVGHPAALGYDRLPEAAQTFAHELGHNFGRYHAPCGNPAGVDAAFPTPDARLDSYGWDVATGQVRAPGDHYDLMSYCGPEWITHYTYRGIMDFRHAFDWSKGSASAAPEPVLVVWGTVRGGEVVLEPAFEVDAPPSLPRRTGAYRLQAEDAAGGALLSLSFDALEVQDAAPGERHFAFAIPRRMLPMDRVAALRLTGPGGRSARVARTPARGGFAPAAPRFSAERAGGRVALKWERAEHPMVLVREAATGQVLSFARGGGVDVHTDAAELELLFSDGVRTAGRRVRVR